MSSPPNASDLKPVVTIWETYGSGADVIGPKVAQALGLPLHEQAFSSEELEQAEAEREKESTLSRVLRAIGGSYVVDGRSIAYAQRDDHDLVQDNNAAVEKSARTGGVIMGRNATRILAGRPNALHVKLDGPLDGRIARAAESAGIDVERAASRQKREDQVRAEMSMQLYRWDPRKSEHYDLIVNTGHLEADICAQIIVAACRAKAATG